MSLRALKPVHPPSLAAAPSVAVAFALRGRELLARFEVRQAPKLHVNPGLARDRSQHGLWDWDVVEVFVRANPASADYFEFQVSPLGQYFELQIHVPRERVNPGFHCEGLAYSAQILRDAGDACDWDAQLKIPLDRLGWDGRPASITGGAFAILGPAGGRTYWGLFLPRQDKPDFHLPQRFRPLLDSD